MTEFGGLRKHEKTQHVLIGLGNAALAAAVALPRVRRPEFPERDNKVHKTTQNMFINIPIHYQKAVNSFANFSQTRQELQPGSH